MSGAKPHQSGYSGVTAARKDKPISSDHEEQFHDAFFKLGIYLESAGLTFDDVLEMKTFHKDIKETIAYIFEPIVAEHLASGRLVKCLEEYCPMWGGYQLYYPSRRQKSPALVEVSRYSS